MGQPFVNLLAALGGITRLHVDSAPLIYFVERHPDYIAQMRAIVQGIRRDGLRLSFSVITIPEVLNKPIARGDTQLQAAYRSLLTRTRNVDLHHLSLPIAERAAFLRARYNLRTPDAIQIATALETGCNAFLTNDRGFQRVEDIRILLLDDLQL